MSITLTHNNALPVVAITAGIHGNGLVLDIMDERGGRSHMIMNMEAGLAAKLAAAINAVTLSPNRTEYVR